MNHHDIFFKQFMARLDVVRGFLLLFVPPRILSQLDLDRITVKPGAFADREGREHFSDAIVYAPTRDGGQLGIYILVDHKSEPEARSPFQLLGYMSHLWDHAVQAGEPLHGILPMVLYHGTRPWPGSTQFEENLALLPGMEPHTPSFSYVLVDLARFDVEAASEPGVLRSGLLALKHISDEAMGGKLSAIFQGLASAGGLSFIRSITVYLTRAARGLSKQDLIHAASDTLPEPGVREVSTIAEQLRAEGQAEGQITGLMHTLSNLVRDGLLTKQQAEQQIDREVARGVLSEADAEKAKQQIAEA